MASPGAPGNTGKRKNLPAPSVLKERARNRKLFEEAKEEKWLRSELSGEQHAAKIESAQFKDNLQLDLELIVSWPELKAKIEEEFNRNQSLSSMVAEDPVAGPSPPQVKELDCEEAKINEESIPPSAEGSRMQLNMKMGTNLEGFRGEDIQKEKADEMATEVHQPKKRVPWVPTSAYLSNTKCYVKMWRCRCGAENLGFRKTCYWCSGAPPPETVEMQRKQKEEMLSFPRPPDVDGDAPKGARGQACLDTLSDKVGLIGAQAFDMRPSRAIRRLAVKRFGTEEALALALERYSS
ncbi:unnamed protein product [Prorocentrum cordatum]|uniref:RanBP2-type domain-containing protein n=1 Tax=Prorocentrum cordatum TaxID=2364126 RepID=A0ABN9WWR2_9DINO|nr:unnamed protein product [Polarella glacialis]